MSLGYAAALPAAPGGDDVRRDVAPSRRNVGAGTGPGAAPPPEVPLVRDGPLEPGSQAPETPKTIVRTADRTLIVLGCREPGRLVTEKHRSCSLGPPRDPDP